MINYFDYAYALPADRAQPFEPTVAVYPTPWNKNTMLLHIGIKGYDLPQAERPDGQSRVPARRVAVRWTSRTSCRCSSARSACWSTSSSPTTASRSSSMPGDAGMVLRADRRCATRQTILAALDQLDAGGSTAGGEGIRLAYAAGRAEFHQGRRQPRDPGHRRRFQRRHHRSERARRTSSSASARRGVFLTVLGFGEGNYNDAHDAEAGRRPATATAAYIDTLNEARKVLVERDCSARCSPSPRT